MRDRIVLEALRAARALTEQLVLHQRPTKDDVAAVDKLLRAAIEHMDTPQKV